MIGLNPLRTKVLITSDEVIFHAPIEGDVDPRLILNNILVAERRFIKPMLGNTLYAALIDKKNKVVTADNKEALQTEINQGRTGRAAIELVEGDMVNADTFFNAQELTLWNDYLHKIIAECVYFAALPSYRARFGTQGVEVNNPASIASGGGKASIELKDLKHLMDASLQSRIAPLMEDMHQYLCSVNFPGYDKDCGCSSDGVAYTKRSSVILGMYDEEERRPPYPC